MLSKMVGRLARILLVTGALSVHAGITFGDENSKIVVKEGSTLNIGTSMDVQGGTIEVEAGGTIAGAGGDATINFTNGTFNNAGTISHLSGSYNLDSDEFLLTGDQTLIAEPGTMVSALRITGTGNKVLGQPSLTGGIILDDATASVTFGIQSVLEQSVTLNGGTFILADDLRCDEGVFFLDSGTIRTEGNVLHTGKLPITPTGDLVFEGNSFVELHCSYGVAGAYWTADSYLSIEGNGNDFILSNTETSGGLTTASGGGTVYLSNVRVRLNGGELATPSIASSYVFDNVTFVIDRDVTLTQGTFTVRGQSTFILGDNLLTFSDDASLTVTNNAVLSVEANYDFMELNYNTITVDDGSMIYDLIAQAPVNELVFTEDATIGRDIVLDGRNKMVIDAGADGGEITITGNGHAITMSGADVTQLQVAAGTTVRFVNVMFREFASGAVLLGEGAGIILGHLTVIHVGPFASLRGAYTVEDEILIDLKGRVAYVENDCVFSILPDASVSIANGTLTNLHGEPFRGSVPGDGEDVPVLAVQDVTMQIEDTMYMQLMQFSVVGKSTIACVGNGELVYESSAPIGIFENSTLTMQNALMTYAPLDDVSQWIGFGDMTTSKLVLDASELHSRMPNVSLAGGIIDVLGVSTLSGEDVPDIGYTTYTMGDGADPASNFTISIKKNSRLLLDRCVILPNEIFG